MKRNVTISLDEEVLEAAREYAARHGKSFQQLARECIEQTVGTNRGKKLQDMFEIADRLNLSLNGWKWNREELYEHVYERWNDEKRRTG